MDDFVELKPEAAAKLERNLRDQSSFSICDPDVPISGPKSGLDEATFSANAQNGLTSKKILSLGYRIAASIFKFLSKLANASSTYSRPSGLQASSGQSEGQNNLAAAATSSTSSQRLTNTNNISAQQDQSDQVAPANTHAPSAEPPQSTQQEPKWLLMCSRPHRLPTTLSHLNTCSVYTDKALFRNIRGAYYSLKSPWHAYLSLKGVASIKFVRVSHRPF